MADTFSPTSTGPTGTGTVRYLPGVIVSTIEECGGPVRWKGRVLEQMWRIRHIGTTGAVEKTTEEWRTVPSAY